MVNSCGCDGEQDDFPQNSMAACAAEMLVAEEEWNHLPFKITAMGLKWAAEFPDSVCFRNR
jgi:hypothetical protein